VQVMVQCTADSWLSWLNGPPVHYLVYRVCWYPGETDRHGDVVLRSSELQLKSWFNSSTLHCHVMTPVKFFTRAPVT